MEIVFSKKAQNDILLWNKSGKKKILKKISELLRDIQRSPYEGIGKPEQLKHNLSGVWSRRIDKEHRLVYEIIDEKTIEILNILSVKGHYE
ncbi:Txe/YoeB family addiction module toxin [Flavobacterium sp. I-SCBP12n]|uniref:Putative mRNA interferase YoeB n=2 Tax=Flavobacterium TaxID=237 RepID=A0A9X2BNQ8_9FLAO|nr:MULTISPECIES: Txe/YoeB family addiction module toxin [Flavobacterium]MBP4141263.1 Txe/YoeB family addiction module toxin [Flavobacterium flabelliforme]MCK8140576.1 Txe/YoeB family addiction module toxin [Flavobacterium pygoscelis]